VIVALLPGMDGTGILFAPFVSQLPRHVQALTFSYPTDVPFSYEQLSDRLLGELPKGKPYVIVAESYSGPIALELATRPPVDLRAIVLVASFAARPLGFLGVCLASLPLTTAFRIRPPRWMLRWLLMESATPPEFVATVQKTILKIRPGVLAARTKEALTVDRRDVVRACPVRIVCLTADRDRLLGARARDLVSQRVEAVTISAPHFLLQCAPKAAVDVMSKLGLFDIAEA